MLMVSQFTTVSGIFPPVNMTLRIACIWLNGFENAAASSAWVDTLQKPCQPIER